MWYNIVNISRLFPYGKGQRCRKKDGIIKSYSPHRRESQRKDGRYAYKYIDTFGKPQFVYSWKLVPTDKTPAGKRDDIALREKEKEIQKDLDDGIDHIGKKMTVCQLYAKQIRHRANVRHGTKQGRNSSCGFCRRINLEPAGLKM